MNDPTGEKGYPLLFFSINTKWKIGALLTFLVLAISAGFYVWYSQHSSDAAPDSIAGYSYAILGTASLLLAGTLYSIRRRSHKKRALGKLNTALHWHIFFAIIGLVLIFMHSFGNLNPRTGTYALYGLIALVISGLVGRTLDHLIPRLIAGEVQQALTARGEDRIETISQKVQALVAHNTEALSSQPIAVNFADFSSRKQQVMQHRPQTSLEYEEDERPLHTPWDLAYISLEATPQELSRLMPDKHRPLTPSAALMPGAQQHLVELHKVQRAMQREHFYRYIIRYWRLLHIALALLTLGLITWHLIYAAQLLLH